jgi:hypothetical protein
MGVTLYLGTDDRVWYALDKHLTILFWLGVVLISLNLYVPLPEVKGVEFVDVTDRFSGTIASLLGPLIAPGLFLGVWGLVSKRRGIWKVLQILAPVASVGIQAGLFLFRSSAVAFHRICCPWHAHSQKSVVPESVQYDSHTAVSSIFISDYDIAIQFHSGRGNRVFASYADVGALRA